MCIREIGRDCLTSCACVEESTYIVISALGNGVLRALLGFMERNYWIVMCLIIFYPTSKGRIWETKIRWSWGFVCWAAAFMTSWLLQEDQEWSCDPLRSRVLCSNVRVCKVEGLVIQESYVLSAHLNIYVVPLFEHIASIKDYITRTPFPFFGNTTILYNESKHNILALVGKANKHWSSYYEYDGFNWLQINIHFKLVAKLKTHYYCYYYNQWVLNENMYN